MKKTKRQLANAIYIAAQEYQAHFGIYEKQLNLSLEPQTPEERRRFEFEKRIYGYRPNRCLSFLIKENKKQSIKFIVKQFSTKKGLQNIYFGFEQIYGPKKPIRKIYDQVFYNVEEQISNKNKKSPTYYETLEEVKNTIKNLGNKIPEYLLTEYKPYWNVFVKIDEIKNEFHDYYKKQSYKYLPEELKIIKMKWKVNDLK